MERYFQRMEKTEIYFPHIVNEKKYLKTFQTLAEKFVCQSTM